jgi:spore coat polysaccharide biosynthesis predicted glycosyltransferase SpsG
VYQADTAYVEKYADLDVHAAYRYEHDTYTIRLDCRLIPGCRFIMVAPVYFYALRSLLVKWLGLRV